MQYLFFLILFLPHWIFGEASMSQKPTICLNMIVKNENHVIQRCLTSVLPIIDYWVIVDTGSNDGTQETIKEFMKQKKVPGELYERSWVDFSHNRNEAMHLAKGKADYLLFIDADEYLVFDPDFKLPLLDRDYYHINFSSFGTKYAKIHLIKNDLDWEWLGVLHEVIAPPASRSFDTLQKVVNTYTNDGARSKDPQKYQKDVEVLKAALEKDPNNSRYLFYLAESYKNAGNSALALEKYEERAAMGGWNEEVFYALFQAGRMRELLNMPKEAIVASYNRAFQYRNSRLEPIYQLVHFYRMQNDFQKGYSIAKIGETIPLSNDLLFVQEWMYDYGLLLELSICAYWTGKYKECQEISLNLLKKANLPENVRSCVQNNLGFANGKLLEELCQIDDSTLQPVTAK